MKYTGSCHCGAIAFEVEGELTQVMSCNCSICSRKGALMWFLSDTAMQLLTPRDTLATYTFNKHVIKHHFCKLCGIHPFGEGSDPQGNAMVAINARCLEDVDFEALPRQHYDGRAR